MISRGALHLYLLDLTLVPPTLPLSPDEIERASRFVYERDRRRFQHARAWLRILLGRYLGRPPLSLTFSYGPQGKPLLPGITFNLSHSEERGLLAIWDGESVGVDIEWVGRSLQPAELIPSVASRTEATYLQGLDPTAQREAFFRLWTRKEAVIKAEGQGLQIPLTSLSVLTTATGEPLASPLTVQVSGRHWHVIDLKVGASFAAAVALSAPPSAIKWLRID